MRINTGRQTDRNTMVGAILEHAGLFGNSQRFRPAVATSADGAGNPSGRALYGHGPHGCFGGVHSQSVCGEKSPVLPCRESAHGRYRQRPQAPCFLSERHRLQRPESLSARIAARFVDDQVSAAACAAGNHRLARCSSSARRIATGTATGASNTYSVLYVTPGG